MPLFLLGNPTLIIPHQLRQHWRSTFPYGLADAADASGKKGSNFYEVNTWLWEFGQGKPSPRGLSVAATEAVAHHSDEGWCKEGCGNKGQQKQQGSEGVAEWNEDIPRISLIQIFVIEISIG